MKNPLAVFVGPGEDAIRQLLPFLHASIHGGSKKFANDIIAVVGVHSEQLEEAVRSVRKNDGTLFAYRPWGEDYRAPAYRYRFEETGAKYAAFIGWQHSVLGLKEKEDFRPNVVFNLSTEVSDFCSNHFPIIDCGLAVLAHQRMGLRAVRVVLRFVVPNPSKFTNFGEGPIIMSQDIPLIKTLTAERLQEIVWGVQKEWQSKIAYGIVNGHIGWNGKKKAPVWGAEILPPFDHAKHQYQDAVSAR